MGLCTTCHERQHSGNCDREALKNQIWRISQMLTAREEELRIARALDAARQKIDMPGVVMVRSLISHRNQKPRIDVQIHELHTQMDADSAMDLAKNLIECCQGAYADAFIFHFMTTQLDQQPEVAARIIEEFREYRDGLKQEFDQLQKEKPE